MRKLYYWVCPVCRYTSGKMSERMCGNALSAHFKRTKHFRCAMFQAKDKI